MDDNTRKWAAKEFGIPEEDITFYNSGTCYDRIGVLTEESANKVTEKVKDQTVNGGIFHGMPLGSQIKKKSDTLQVDVFYIIC